MKLTNPLFIWILVLPLVFTCLGAYPQNESVHKLVSAALAVGKTEELVKYFNNMVDLGLPGSEDTYSKTQAQRILEDFFHRNPVKSYKNNRVGTSGDGSQFSIGILEAGGKQYRVYYLLKKVVDKPLIQQFQIQEEK